MEQGKAAFEGFSEITRSFFSLDVAKRIVESYIDAGERIADSMLEFQAKMNEWAKNTPLYPLFEAQYSLETKLKEVSANVARRLWRIEQKRAV
jgi:hypothetical protein